MRKPSVVRRQHPPDDDRGDQREEDAEMEPVAGEDRELRLRPDRSANWDSRSSGRATALRAAP